VTKTYAPVRFLIYTPSRRRRTSRDDLRVKRAGFGRLKRRLSGRRAAAVPREIGIARRGGRSLSGRFHPLFVVRRVRFTPSPSPSSSTDAREQHVRDNVLTYYVPATRWRVRPPRRKTRRPETDGTSNRPECRTFDAVGRSGPLGSSTEIWSVRETVTISGVFRRGPGAACSARNFLWENGGQLVRGR